MSKLNVRLLRRIQKRILADPALFNMNDFVNTRAQDANDEPCGTACCIGGYAVLLGVPNCKITSFGTWDAFYYTNGKPIDPGLKAVEILGLPNEDLFYVSNWPDDLRAEYGALSGDRAGRAQIAAKVIDRVIAGTFVGTTGRPHE